MEEYDPHREHFVKGYTAFSMSSSHIFFWNGQSVWMYDILNFQGRMTKLALRVSRFDTLSKIKNVYTGSKPDQVVIVLK